MTPVSALFPKGTLLHIPNRTEVFASSDDKCNGGSLSHKMHMKFEFLPALLLIVSASVGQAQTTDLTATVLVNGSTVVRQIPNTLFGTNVEWVWDAYSLWNEQLVAPDPVLIKAATDLDVSLIRYPGGMYADFYHWQNGIGPYSSRPLVQFRVGDTDVDNINFGTNEALQFAQEVNGQLLITVNAGTGTAAEAAAWVKYVNAQSLKVLYWEVGNELYINDGSAAQNAITIDPLTYANRFRQFATAMRAADPRIKIGAIGGQNQGAYGFNYYPNWDQIVLQNAGDQIDFFAVHNSYAPVNVNDTDSFDSVYQGLLAAPTTIAKNLQTLQQQIQMYAPKSSNISVAVTEWGPLFQVTTAGAYAQHTKTLGSALFAASMLKTFMESPVTQIANFHVFNDMSIMCWICSSDGSFPPHPVWTSTAESMAFQLVRQHFGTQLLSSMVSVPSFNSPAVGTMSSVSNVPYLDIVSSLSADGKTLYVIGINKSFTQAIRSSITLLGFTPSPAAASWTLNGTGMDANTGTVPLKTPGTYWAPQAEDPQNPQFDNGGPGQVTVTAGAISNAAVSNTYRFPAHSVTVLQFSHR
jgi:alpha-L-arabinofuranosidase